MTDATAFIMTDILHNDAISGTAKILNFANIPLAAKTGTVAWDNGNKDVWLASYNSDYVVISWMGFDKTDSTHYLSVHVTGGTFPAQVCKSIYAYLYKKTTAPQFHMPDSVTLLAIDKLALQNTQQILLASPQTPESQKLYDYFPKSQAPTQVSQYWQTPITPTGFNLTLSSRGYPVVSFLIMQDFARYDIYRLDSYNQTAKVTSINGAANQITSFEDMYVSPGTYSYYISPVRPDLNISGNPTNTLQITVGNGAILPTASQSTTQTPIFPFYSTESPVASATP